jgi:hypothetical protein
MNITDKRLNQLSWIFYLIASTFYAIFNILRIPQSIFANETITLLTVVMVSIAIFCSLAVHLGWKRALVYIIYWSVIVIIIEKIYLTTGRYEYAKETATIIGNVPYLIALNWLLSIFVIYTIPSFIVSRFDFKGNKRRQLIRVLSFDLLIILVFGLIHEVTNVAIGAWSFAPTSIPILVWGVPLSIFIEYLIGHALFVFPLRYYETYKEKPKDHLFYTKISFPLYYTCLFFVLATLRAYSKGVMTIAVFGTVVMIIYIVFIIWKRKNYKNKV